MGTHSTVKFYNRGHNILNIYNQYDGYISGEGIEILNFLEDERWQGNGIDDLALLYVCYKKDGKPYHTYATTETDIQEYNYTIYQTDDGLMFKVTEETWDSENERTCLVTLLRYGTLKEFKRLVQTEYLRDLIFMEHCEEIDDDTRQYYRKMNFSQLLEQARLHNWNNIIEKIDLKDMEEEEGEF